MTKTFSALAAATLLAVSGAASAAPTQLITNGDFNAGLSGWTVTNAGSGNWFISTVGANTPTSSQTTSAVGGSGQYAVTDQSGGGSHILSQNFNVAAGASSVIVSFSMFANDKSGVGPINGGDLSATSGRANQHARVDIMKASAAPFSVAASDIVMSLMGPMVDAGNFAHDFTSYNFDITSAVSGGGTFALRFAEVDNQFFFNMGVDNVSVQASSGALPEPASVLLTGAALLALGAARRRTRRG